MEDRQKVVKNFCADSELAHFWLFFTPIPADPRDRSVAGWVIDGCRRLHSRARKDYSGVHAAGIEGRQESVKKFFTNSKLSNFWLFFARIPADPLLQGRAAALAGVRSAR